MANERYTFHCRGIPLAQTHKIRRYKAIIELKEQVRKLTRELEQVRGSIST